MTRNMGGVDRLLRAIIGLAIIAVGLYFGSWWGLVGLIPIATATMGFCPAYCPFKINTTGKPTTSA